MLGPNRRRNQRRTILKNERREHKRTFFTQSPERALHIYIDGLCVKIGSVWDVSPFGVGLQIDGVINLDNIINKGTDVMLTYQAEGINLRVRGFIMWSMVFVDNLDSTGVHRSYRMGVSLQSDDIEDNITFFKYVTGQLDNMQMPQRMSRN